jgi:hypothetical protein
MEVDNRNYVKTKPRKLMRCINDLSCSVNYSLTI